MSLALAPQSPLALQKQEMDLMLCAVDKLTPCHLKKEEASPVHPQIHLSNLAAAGLESPLNATVFACLTMCLHASVRLGEFIVSTLNGFNHNTHITAQLLTHNGFRVTALHLPTTKLSGTRSEDFTGPRRKVTPTPQQPLSTTSRSTSRQRVPTCLHTRLHTHAAHSPSQSFWKGSGRLPVWQAMNCYRDMAEESG